MWWSRCSPCAAARWRAPRPWETDCRWWRTFHWEPWFAALGGGARVAALGGSECIGLAQLVDPAIHPLALLEHAAAVAV